MGAGRQAGRQAWHTVPSAHPPMRLLSAILISPAILSRFPSRLLKTTFAQNTRFRLHSQSSAWSREVLQLYERREVWVGDILADIMKQYILVIAAAVQFLNCAATRPDPSWMHCSGRALHVESDELHLSAVGRQR